MMLLCGQVNRVWHFWAGRYPGSVGLLVGPSYFHRVPIDPWMPYALDNDAFSAWDKNKPWNYDAWREMLWRVNLLPVKPRWVLVPDSVGSLPETMIRWRTHWGDAKLVGAPLAFAVQDGCLPHDVPKEAEVIFVGGTDAWKFKNLPMWTRKFPRVHCARVNAPEMIEACDRLGCESIDGTGWFREPSRRDKLPFLQRFIEGHRNATQELPLNA